MRNKKLMKIAIINRFSKDEELVIFNTHTFMCIKNKINAVSYEWLSFISLINITPQLIHKPYEYQGCYY